MLTKVPYLRVIDSAVATGLPMKQEYPCHYYLYPIPFYFIIVYGIAVWNTYFTGALTDSVSTLHIVGDAKLLVV
jgi:hypothetical protein